MRVAMVREKTGGWRADGGTLLPGFGIALRNWEPALEFVIATAPALFSFETRRMTRPSEAMTKMHMSLGGILVVLASLVGMAGCQHIGPRMIMEDRIPYNHAISTSWKQQALLNIVRLRYGDLPEWVDVPSIVSGFEHARETNIGLGFEIFPRDTSSNLIAPELSGSRAVVDRPTISYKPQTDSEFTRNLIRPIPPISILNLIESGAPADIILELAVESINGIRNRGFTGTLEEGDPEFQHIAQIMRKAQASGHVSLQAITKPGSESPDVEMVIRGEQVEPTLAAELAELRSTLRLDPSVNEFKVVYGVLPQDKTEIAFQTRSVLRIMTYLALNVQVPECHIADGIAPDLNLPPSASEPLLTVHSACEPPCDPYSVACYQNNWFWIDPRDFNSKRTMLYLKILLALADTQERFSAPALTIRAN
jgi:hypothetical protein